MSANSRLPDFSALIPRVPPAPVFFLISLALSGATTFGLLIRSPLPREAAFMSGIFILSTLLWLSEAIPLFATALLIIGLETVLLANPGDWPGFGFASGASPKWTHVLNTAADPMLLLFFGGFVLSQSAVKTGVDRTLSALLLRPFGTEPKRVLLGVMLVTLLFGMWMSNTATAAMMLALVTPMLAVAAPGDPFRKALLLAVPFAANIGGMTTPIASPPNAVAIGFLADSGHRVSFLAWMAAALPLALLLVGVAWLVLAKMFPVSTPGLRFVWSSEPLDRRGKFVVAVFVVTVLLWISDGLHGLPPAIVALLPAVSLTATGIFDRDDLGKLEWRIIILIAGGISLGTGMQISGLDKIIAGLLPVSQGDAFLPLLVLVPATLVVGSFMSNSAVANLFLPIGISLSAAAPGAAGVHPVRMAMSIAMAASLSMALPISTPPNALAYARGEFSSGEMAKASLIISTVGMALILAGGGFVLLHFGLLS